MKVEFMDRVKNKITNVGGIVIAMYPDTPGSSKWFVDICTDEHRIWYESPIENWVVVEKYNEE